MHTSFNNSVQNQCTVEPGQDDHFQLRRRHTSIRAGPILLSVPYLAFIVQKKVMLNNIIHFYLIHMSRKHVFNFNHSNAEAT